MRTTPKVPSSGSSHSSSSESHGAPLTTGLLEHQSGLLPSEWPTNCNANWWIMGSTYGVWGAAWVVHLQQDHCFRRLGLFMFASSTLYTEATACLHAIKWAHTNGRYNVLVLTDSALLVRYAESRTMTYISI